MPVDADERQATIAATIANYISGEFGENRARSLLCLCGLNATEIEELLGPHRKAAFEKFKSYKRRP